MCTSIIEVIPMEGMAKRSDEWFALAQTVVAYDHARHAAFADVITLDFVNIPLGADARAGIELTLESAKALCAALDRAIAAAEFEEAKVRGKGAATSIWAARDAFAAPMGITMETGKTRAGELIEPVMERSPVMATKVAYSCS